MNAILFYIDDWLGSVKILGMTAMEECAFFRLLLISAKSDDCSLPADDRKLAHYARLTPGEWGRSKGHVLECFETLPNGRWRNARLYVEWRRQRKYTAERSRSGLKGAESRWQTNSSAIAEPIAAPSSCEMAEPSKNTHEQIAEPLAEPSKTGGKSMAEPMQVREVGEEKNTPASVVLPTSVDSKVFKGENALSPDASATPARIPPFEPGDEAWEKFIDGYPKQTKLILAQHAFVEKIGCADDPQFEFVRLIAGKKRLLASDTDERLAKYAPTPQAFILDKRYLDPWPLELKPETKDQKLGREVEASMQEERGK